MLAMDLNLNATNESQELRSVSLTVELEEVQDSILLHLTNLLDSAVRTRTHYRHTGTSFLCVEGNRTAKCKVWRVSSTNLDLPR